MSHTKFLEIKADFDVEADGTITGIAWPFSGPDRTNDTIEKGAFSNAKAPLPALYAHDQAQAVGVWNEINETDRGLEVRGRLLIDDVPKAREVRALIKSGAVRGLSIGFIPKSASNRKGGGRTIRNLDLLEISIVSVPAHADAQITSAKAVRAAYNTSHHTENNSMDDDMTPEAAQDENAVDTKNIDPNTIDAIVTKHAEVEDKLGDILNRLEKAETRLNRPNVVSSDRKADHEASERKAFGNFIRRGDTKDLAVNSESEGGFLAPGSFVADMVRKLVEISPVRQYATVTSIGTGELTLPKVADDVTAHWVGETEASTESTPAFGQVSIPVHELATHVDVSNRLIEDAAVDIFGELSRMFAEKFAKAEGVAFVSGDAHKKPEGILTSDDIGTVANGHASDLKVDGLLSLYHDLPTAYASNAVWMMNRATMSAVRMLKDANGNYLWREDLTAANPPTILGRPVVEVPDMPNATNGATPILFGDIGQTYRIVDRVGLTTLRDPYSQAANRMTRVYATRRVGAGVTKGEAARKLIMTS